MDEVDKVAIECLKIETGTRNIEVLKSKHSLLQISRELRPILKCGKMYVVLDGPTTAYVYEEK